MRRFGPLRLALGATLFVALVAGCNGSGGGTPGNPGAFGASGNSVAQRSGIAAFPEVPAPAFSAPLLPPPGTIYLGAYVAPAPDESPQAQITATATFEATIGRKLAMNLHYHLWSDTLAGVGEYDDAANGRIPFVSWECADGVMSGVKDADIAAGLYDAAIARRAQAVANFGHPIFLRYKWEMNLVHNANCADPAHDIVDQYGKTHYSPPEYIAAWQHIRAIFAANGATNVVWVWNPSGNGIVPNRYYPGDSQVDWVAFDWYDTFNLYFDTIYTYTYNKTTGRSVWTYPYYSTHYPTKPLMIGETGAEQTWQPSYFSGGQGHPSAEQALRKRFKNIQAYVYWNSTGGRGNYQILQPGLPSFITFANSAYMSGKAP